MLNPVEVVAERLSGWLSIAVLAILPFSENRGAIIYGASLGYDPLAVFIVSTFLNIIVMVPLLIVLNTELIRRLIDKILGGWIARKIEKNRKKLELYEELALLIFVAVPFVGTGGYTGSLVSAFLKMDPKKSFVVIAAGIIIAGTISLLVTEGVLSFMNMVG